MLMLDSTWILSSMDPQVHYQHITSQKQPINNHYLPGELRILIIDAYLAQIFTNPCPFRNHIVNILKEQQLMNFHPSKDIGHYLQTHHTNDEYIRYKAFKRMDRRERRFFTRVFSAVTKIASVNTWSLKRSLLAQKRWLSHTTAMSFRDFQIFCNDAKAHQNPASRKLVLELFTQLDFLDPAPEISDPVHTIP